jgi:hypothetical protein
MADAFYADNNRFQTIHNSDISFDTDRPSIELFNDARIVKTNYVIEFPNFLTGYAYYRSSVSGETTCQVWSTILWQEWGPDEGFNNEFYTPIGQSNPGPSTRNLPRDLLGSVPAGTTYLDVRVRLTRTHNPDPWYAGNAPVITTFKQGDWINLPGGSCPCELIGSVARQFDITRIGNNVYLERRQSGNNANTENSPGGPQAAVSVNQSGWNSQIWGPIYEPPLSPYSSYHIAHLIDNKPPDQNGNKRPNGTNPCGGRTTIPNTRSVYTGDILITPGRHRT